MIMPELYGIGEAAVYVDDVDAAEDWYKDVLGLETAFRGDHYCFLDAAPDGPARQHVILFDPAATADQDAPPAHGTDAPTHLALDVPQVDLDAWRDRLDAHDVRVEHERTYGSGDRSLYVRDPAGNSIELYAQTE